MPDRVLTLAVRSVGPGPLLLHLGDADNSSCRGELDAFLQTMRGAAGARPWFMLPGNHDGYYLGDAQPREGTYEWRQWVKACSGTLFARDSAPLHTSDFIRTWVDSVSGGRATPDADWAPASPTVLERLHYGIEPRQWRSFVVQQLALGDRLHAVMIDTASFELRPWATGPGNPLGGLLHRNAGLTGEINAPEAAVLDRWVAELAARGEDVLLFGHHPYDSLTWLGRRVLSRLVAHGNVVAYVAAHKHHPGRFLEHDLGGTVLAELVIGSITDWPMEFVYLDVDRKGERSYSLTWTPVRMATDLHAVADAPECTRAGVGPRQTAMETREYLRYRLLRGKGESLRTESLLRTYQTMFRDLDDPMRASRASWPESFAGEVARLRAEVDAALAGGPPDEDDAVRLARLRPALAAAWAWDRREVRLDAELPTRPAAREFWDYEICTALQASDWEAGNRTSWGDRRTVTLSSPREVAPETLGTWFLGTALRGFRNRAP